jgi:hypothetical protein
MKRILIVIALIFSAVILKAEPGRGGYLGRRFIVGAEGAYSPYFNSVSAFFTRYNFQYGGKIGIIVARRSELDLDYNMYSLGGNELYRDEFYKSDRVKGSEFGISLKTFRKERGGIAPIGKFYDIGLSYAMNKFVAGPENKQLEANNSEYNFNMTSDQVLFHLSYGTQMVFWDHLVANTGIRFGTPVVEVGHTGENYRNFFMQRMRMKEAFSVFFGAGFLF